MDRGDGGQGSEGTRGRHRNGELEDLGSVRGGVWGAGGRQVRVSVPSA